jgi:hypothetical protein
MTKIRSLITATPEEAKIIEVGDQSVTKGPVTHAAFFVKSPYAKLGWSMNTGEDTV